MPVETLSAGPGAGSASSPASGRTRLARWRTPLAVAVAFAAGVALTGGFLGGNGGGASSAATIADVAVDVDAAHPVPVEVGEASVSPGQPAATPVAAVEGFLDAEADGDFETSYELLTDAQRASYGSPAAWVEAHAEFFPVVDYQIIEDRGDGTVIADVQYRSSLDDVIGLVPARARVEWPAVQHDVGWLVDFDGAQVGPVFPAEGAATEAASEWATALQRCEEPEQYAGALVASLRLVRQAEDLCNTAEAIRAGSPRPLDPADANALVSVFGAQAQSWARSVDISGPIELTVILAPVDDEWLVVGLLAPT